MNWTRDQLKSNAKLMLKKNWLSCVVVSFIVAIFAGTHGFNVTYTSEQTEMNNLVSNIGGEWTHWLLQIAPFLAGFAALIGILSILFTIFVGNPLKVGGARFYLHNIHSQGELNDLAFPFANQYQNVVLCMFFRELYIFLWMLLFIIPGIIKEYEYFLVPYLLADNPELGPEEVRRLSSQMMYGEKMNTFLLHFSFILWNFLSSITGGIVGLLWVNPYIDATDAELYTAIKTRWEEDHGRSYY